MRIAAYARYSSDSQREASIEDQLRNCRAYCARQGWPAPTVFSDSAISGARSDRAAYLRLLASIDNFDVLLIDDLSRFGRDKDDVGKAVKRLVFAGVRLIGISDGVDTARKSHKADVGLRGLMSELYLDDLADKTHRGLTGRALSGASAGGLPYGYTVVGTGQRAIDETQAAIVRRIYAEYIAGTSPRSIAAGLNRDSIAPPRGRTWSMSAIYGDVRRGLGILANPIYAGQQVWNRSHWVKHPDTGRRIRKERPQSEWIITDKPELAIITRAIWEAAQKRIRTNSHNTTVSTTRGGPGRPPRHLLSGILRCAECGGPMVIVDRYRYGCSTHKDRGASACPSKLRVPRIAAETALLASVRNDLLSDQAFQRFQRTAAAALKRATPDIDAAKRAITSAEREHANIMQAIRAGIITPSTRAALVDAERALDAARDHLQAIRNHQPAQILPRAREAWRRIVATLADTARNTPAARTALRDLLGDTITLKTENGALFAEIAPSECQISMVAGAGFEPATFGL